MTATAAPFSGRVIRDDVHAAAEIRYPVRVIKLDHPNEPGKWTRLETATNVALWRRDRSDPFPVVQFYLLAPPRQTEVLYDEAVARSRFESLSGKDETQAA